MQTNNVTQTPGRGQGECQSDKFANKICLECNQLSTLAPESRLICVASPVAGDVAGWAIVRHLVPLVMVVTMGVMAVVSGPVRLRKRICPRREIVNSEKSGSVDLLN